MLQVEPVRGPDPVIHSALARSLDVLLVTNSMLAPLIHHYLSQLSGRKMMHMTMLKQPDRIS